MFIIYAQIYQQLLSVQRTLFKSEFVTEFRGRLSGNIWPCAIPYQKFLKCSLVKCKRNTSLPNDICSVEKT